jgi:hypothetical protein
MVVSPAMAFARAPHPGPLRLRRRAHMTRCAVLLVAALAGMAVAACNSAGSLVIPGSDPLVTVEMRGGMCPAGACASTVFLDRDGRAHSAAKPPNDLGVVQADRMAALSSAITAADFATIKAKRFIGDCPVAFDGQELVFEFAAPGGTQRIASCEVDIDWGSPLFVALAAAIGEWVPLPLT